MEAKDMVMTRQEAKQHLCSECSGTRMSGSYFSNECKGEAEKCQRITDFIRGYKVKPVSEERHGSS